MSLFGRRSSGVGSNEIIRCCFNHLAAPFAFSTGSAIVPPVVEGGLSLGKKAALQIADLAVPDFIFDQDEYFANKEKEKLEEDLNKSKETANEKKN